MFGLDDKKTPLDDNDSLESTSTRQETLSFGRNEVLLCATHGKIYAIHKKDGTRCWRQDFPTGALGGIVSLFVTDNDTVIVGGNGKTASLDLFTGVSTWVNKMKGFGYDEVGVIATPSRYIAPPKETTEAPPPAYAPDASNEKQMIYGCSSGKVLAMDPLTGEEVWRFSCPKGGFNIPAVLIEPPCQVWPFQVIYVGCGRWVYCLASVSGELLWSERITNSKFGLGFMCLATPWSSRLAAESHTSFSATPHAQNREMERRRHHSNSG